MDSKKDGNEFNELVEIKNIKSHHNQRHIESQNIKLFKDYDPLAIPPDWELAQTHALSRRVAKEKFSEANAEVKICPCCGYEADREELSLWCNIKEISFLGSGFPLYLNFVKYCMFLLFVLLICYSIPCLITASKGSFCEKKFTAHKGATHTVIHNFQTPNKRLIKIGKPHPIPQSPETNFNLNSEEKAASGEKGVKSAESHKGTHNHHSECRPSLITRYSFANKIGHKELVKIDNIFGVFTMMLVIVILVVFRYSQRKLDSEVDEGMTTPADFTIIAQGLPWMSIQDITEFFTFAIPETELHVKKVNMVFNIEEIEEKEHEISHIVKIKQKLLLQNGFNLQDHEIKKLDKEILHEKEKLELLCDSIQKDEEKFTGIALVSFNSEYDKERLLDKYHMSELRKMMIKFRGKEKYFDNYLFYNEHLINVKQAPEPNDIAWENMHYHGKEIAKRRLEANLLNIGLLFLCFVMIFIITYFQKFFVEKAEEAEKEHKIGAPDQIRKVKLIALFISIIIVLFNKFGMAHLIHPLVHKEVYKTFTEENISFGQKYAMGLFFNTALITFGVEILAFNNFFGMGGMVETEFYVFVLNAFFPPLVYLVDPWGIIQNFKRWNAFRKFDKTKNDCVLTQGEANLFYSAFNSD